RLKLVDLEALCDDFFLVVRALLQLRTVLCAARRARRHRVHVVHRSALGTHTTSGQTFHERLTAYIQEQHGIERLPDLFEKVFERLCLVDVARESIEDEDRKSVV